MDEEQLFSGSGLISPDIPPSNGRLQAGQVWELVSTPTINSMIGGVGNSRLPR
jgi:hypothetical protein